MHLNLTLHDNCNFPYCYDDGKYGLDSASALVDTIFDDMYSQYDTDDSVNVIVLSGDFVMHGLAASQGETNWDAMKDTINSVVDKVKSKFPDAKIMPCIGNNDVVNHYQAPDVTEKDQYYTDLYNIWFAGVP